MDKALAAWPRWRARGLHGIIRERVRGMLWHVFRLFVAFSASYTYHTCACISRSDWKIMTQPNDVKRRRAVGPGPGRGFTNGRSLVGHWFRCFVHDDMSYMYCRGRLAST